MAVPRGTVERRYRLRRSGDVRRVYDEGKSWVHPLLVLIVRLNDLDHTRVAVVAGRRVGNAVARNRAKRLMREATRAFYPYIQPGWDIVLVGRRRILETKTPQVGTALALLARRARITRAALDQPENAQQGETAA